MSILRYSSLLRNQRGPRKRNRSHAAFPAEGVVIWLFARSQVLLGNRRKSARTKGFCSQGIVYCLYIIS